MIPNPEQSNLQFNDQQQQQVRQLLESMHMGDVEFSADDLETALTLAIEATEDDIDLWYRRGEEHFGCNEWEVDPAVAKTQTAEFRLALVAQLVRSAAHQYGFGWQGTPRTLLRGICDIANSPTPEDERQTHARRV